MHSELFHQISAALDQLFDLSPADRDRVLVRLREQDSALAAELQSTSPWRSADPLLTGDGATPLAEAVARSGASTVDRDSVSAGLEPSPVPPPVASLLAAGMPRQVGRYLVQEKIGQGGMGAVLRVRDPNFERTLAVKILLPSTLGNPDAEKRFLAEARLTGQLQHPGIPPVHELGWLESGLPFFAMKLIKGQTLAQLLQEGGAPSVHRDSNDPGNDPAPPSAKHDPRWVGIFRHVCQTLAYAHNRGIIHRDLKPGNIMVGAFGEVQVMDWGLAKLLAHLTREVEETSPGSRVDALPHPRTGEVSQTGDVMGTPAYMAPEQARGEIRTLDPRCDVFGLGAILCEILTGQPPFVGDNPRDLLLRSADGNLADAFHRLEASGADAELVALARNCLAPRKEHRPRHAGEVAEAIEQYEAQVQDRLRRAELDKAQALVQAQEERKRRQVEQARAQAEQDRADEECKRRQAEQARADEEQKRRQIEQGKVLAEKKGRRVQRYLAAAIILFVLAGSGTAVWFLGEQAHRSERQQFVSQEVADALDQVTRQLKELHATLGNPLKIHRLLSDVNQWRTTLHATQAVWRRAQALAASDQDLLTPAELAHLQQLGQQLQTGWQDFELAEKLDRIRLEASALVDGKFDMAGTATRYAQLFEEAGLKITTEEPAKFVARIRQSPIRFAWVAALDDWVKTLAQKKSSREQEQLVVRLLEVARNADPDPWRDLLRAPKADMPRLQRLARTVNVSQQSPQTLVLLALKLPKAQARSLLRQAVAIYPQDFWLHFHQGDWGEGPLEQAGCYRAALAIRPYSSVAHNNLGVALSRQKDPGGATLHYRKALDIDPNHALAHNNLGVALADQKDYAGALRHYRQALAIDPNHAPAHYNLANALSRLGNVEGAIRHYRQALAIAPNYSSAYGGLGNALIAKKDLDGAIRLFRKTLELDPKSVEAHNNLGTALRRKKDVEGAIRLYRKALEIDPKDADVHSNLGTALCDKQDLDGAIRHYHTALEINSNHADAHCNLGHVLHLRNDLKGATAHYRRALELAPNHAQAHYHLGITLSTQEDLAGAIRHFRKALEIDPRHADAHYDLAVALYKKRDLEGVIHHLRKALAIDPRDARAHYNLGNALFDTRDLDGATRHYQKALAIDPNLALAHNNLGNIARARGDLASAVAHYRKALDIDPNLALAHNNMGVALFDRKDLAGAIREFRRALQLDPNSTSANSHLAEALLQQRDLEGAVKQFRKALQLEPKNTMAHYQLGNALLELKDSEGAVSHYRQALELDPKHVRAWTNLGAALRARKDLRGAVAALTKAINLDPNEPNPRLILGQAFRDSGNFAQAAASFQAALQLLPRQHLWHRLAENQFRECQLLVTLEKRLAPVLAGAKTTAAEQLNLAILCCAYKARFADAVHLYTAAFATKPPLAEDLAQGHRYRAACAAALAANARGNDASNLTPNDRAKLRQQALVWLNADLQAWKGLRQSSPQSAMIVKKQLERWQGTLDLASVRGDKALAQLPGKERQAWQQLWTEVEKVCK
jgi:tetratricopeptide (TPR) repeat protein